MFKVGDFVFLMHPKGMGKNWKGATIAQVVEPNEFPELREQLRNDILSRGLPEETMQEMIAVKWLGTDILSAEDGFYLAARFVSVEAMTKSTLIFKESKTNEKQRILN